MSKVRPTPDEKVIVNGQKPRIVIYSPSPVNEGKLFEELVKDYGKSPSPEIEEIINTPDWYIRSFWATHSENFLRVSIIFAFFTVAFFIFL